MSASDGTHRIQHSRLVTQQRRLRHLSSLSARNIVTDEGHREKESLMETYFTLHTWPSLETVYTSEKIHNSLNPTWRSFDLQMSCPNLDTSQSAILVRLWGGQTADYSLVIEWKVDLRGLCFLGSQIHKDGVRYQPNSIIFGMFQGFYGAPDNLSDSSSIYNEFRTSIEVEQTSANLSYKIFSLGRLHTTQRAIKQTEASVSKVRSTIVEKLNLVRKKTALCSEREALKLRLGVLKYEQDKQEVLLEADCKKCTKNRESIDSKAQDLTLRQDRLQSEIDELQHQNQLHREKKEQLQKLAAKHTARKTTLLGELADIYPVVELANHEHTILGIKLPNAERYSGTDDMVVSTGLGHTCHLILMMSQILKLPLRYPMTHYGSRSLVRDHITESLAEKDRDFPLYSRGKERFQFNYALYLLNRNIAQLRFAMGMQTTDLRATLPNLKTLLELKWGIKNNTSNMIYQAPRSLRQADQSDGSAQQQQRRLPLAGSNSTQAQRVVPYPVQAPPAYNQIDATQQPQHDTPPPIYQPVEIGQTPPPSPYTDRNSPFEDLTPETEPAVASAPIPIPSVDMAAKAIEAKQAMLIKHRDSNERTGQTTAVIETQVATLSLEDNSSNPRSTETLRPSMEYRDKENSWPLMHSLDGNNGSPFKTHLSDPLEVAQVQITGQQVVSSASIDRENSPEALQSHLQGRPLRISLEGSGPGQIHVVLPEFAPSGQLITSEQPALAAPAATSTAAASTTQSSATNGGQASPTNTNNHHNSGTESSQLFLLPKESELTIQTPEQLVLSQESSNPNVSVHCHSNESEPKIIENQSVEIVNRKLVDPVDENLLGDVSIPRRSVAVGITPRGKAKHSMDADAVNQFDDLGSRAEALSTLDSFSSFKKSSSSPTTKARKSGKV